jgi:hypothetical protein
MTKMINVSRRGAAVGLVLLAGACGSASSNNNNDDDEPDAASAPVDALNPCAGDPCANDGTCVPDGTAFSCDCQPGWTGDTCATDIDECAENLDDCGVGATCENTEGSFECACDGSQEIAGIGAVDAFEVPACAETVTITARGAQGGGANGGLGASMTGTFTVTGGETLKLVVGLQGDTNTCGAAPASGGGGGGTFVWRTDADPLPMIAAGGGGGGNGNWGVDCADGLDASAGEDGVAGSGATSALGGTGGSGGAGNAPSGTGAGGAGWLSAGQNSTYDGTTGGQGLPSFAGGVTAAGFAPGFGGFGGGGGAVCGCGGGGGYSGGGGGEGFSCRAGGGGGGSYNGGTDQDNVGGVITGDGSITITWQ